MYTQLYKHTNFKLLSFRPIYHHFLRNFKYRFDNFPGKEIKRGKIVCLSNIYTSNTFDSKVRVGLLIWSDYCKKDTFLWGKH